MRISVYPTGQPIVYTKSTAHGLTYPFQIHDTQIFAYLSPKGGYHATLYTYKMPNQKRVDR